MTVSTRRMDLFEGLWFDCEEGDNGVTQKEQVRLLFPLFEVIKLIRIVN